MNAVVADPVLPVAIPVEEMRLAVTAAAIIDLSGYYGPLGPC